MRILLNCLGLALALLFGTASAAWADDLTVCSESPPCNKSSVVKANTTWEEGTYKVLEHIRVRRGATLTLEPGATLKFANLGISLVVEGTLIAQGTEGTEETEGKPITFTSGQDTPAAGDWGGILFTRTANGASFKKTGEYVRGSILEHCVVEFAGGGTSEAAIWAKSPRAPFVFHSTIQKNKTSGIRFEGNHYARILENTISENGGSGIYIKGGKATLSDNTISENGPGNGLGNNGDGIELYVGTATLSHNTIWDNLRRGITVGGTATLSDNTISGNTSVGFYLTMGKATLSDNTIGTDPADDTLSGNLGGGVLINSGKATLSGNTISGNGKQSGTGSAKTSSGNGVTVVGTAMLKSNTISDNLGSGVNITGRATLSKNTISGNNLSGITVEGAATIRENQILNNKASINDKASDTGGGILANSTKVIVSQNDILGNSPRQFWNGNPFGSPNLNARNNWWGSTDEAVIQGGIWDWNDDLGLGEVTWDRFRDAPISPSPPSSAP